MLEYLTPYLMSVEFSPLFKKTKFWYRGYDDDSLYVAYCKEHSEGHKDYDNFRDQRLPILQTKEVAVFEDVWFLKDPLPTGKCLNPFWVDLANPEGCFLTQPAPKKGDHFDLMYVMGSGEHDTPDPYRFLVYSKEIGWGLFRFIPPPPAPTKKSVGVPKLQPSIYCRVDRVDLTTIDLMMMRVIAGGISSTDYAELKRISKGSTRLKNTISAKQLSALCIGFDLDPSGTRAEKATRLLPIVSRQPVVHRKYPEPKLYLSKGIDENGKECLTLGYICDITE